ncbi:transporter substrate-binding domain-containing protein [Cohnella hashimotonis]|uniref:Transporter substrate-binding domain-containing protein n=1 Tax=Cohnella hashimotonis TaxID=2826895 RepID=A0ABT6TJI6_9BACL|nr:transporter substrate-binding domain-containing protein [Cohnella hashimotonis]MDI4647013.1 transporter substrate-binding domain-containing protein [Cohnella hashimotonis]
MKKWLSVTLTIVIFLTVTACGNNKSTPDAAGQDKEASEPETITVGLVNGIPKISVLDESGKWTGYDYETLVKIDDLLPQYVFKYEPITDFQAAFVGLDTKSFDILAVHASWTEERAAKYLYGEASNYENSGYTLKVKKGSGIVVKSEEDLGGLKIALAPGAAVAGDVEKYNEQHPDRKIEVVWDTGTVEQQLANLKSGAIDALFGEPLNDKALLEAYGADAFDIAGSHLFYDAGKKNGTYLLFNYGSEPLQKDIDEAINHLLKDGTLSNLSKEILGIDVTVKPD